MAPTSILAEQHYALLAEIVEKMPLSVRPRIAMLTGAIKVRHSVIMAYYLT